jgi:uncharacterized membrane protein
MSRLIQRLKNPILQQNLAELLFPLLGYFIFEWSIVIIAGYYVIDFIASKLAFIRRFKLVNINNKQRMKKPIVWVAVLGILFIVFSTVYITYFGLIESLQLSIESINDELFSFLKNEGWFLIPVILVVNYFKDSMTFVAPRRFLNHNNKLYLRFEFFKTLLSLIGVILFFALWNLLSPSSWIMLLLFVCLKSIFDFYLIPKIDYKSLIDKK